MEILSLLANELKVKVDFLIVYVTGQRTCMYSRIEKLRGKEKVMENQAK